jgi:hypothetical protein
MKDFKDILHIPVIVSSMGTNSERWKITKKRLDDQGFTNYLNWGNADGRNESEIQKAWDWLDIKNVDLTNFDFGWSGVKAGTLSYLGILKYIIDRQIPYALVLEDDIQFHPDFLNKGQYLWSSHIHKEVDWDMIYLGHAPEWKVTSDVSSGNVYGAWSILYSLKGARKVYRRFLKHIYENNLNCFDLVMYGWQTETIRNEKENIWKNLNKDTLQWMVWSTRHYDWAKTDEYRFWEVYPDPFGNRWRYDGIIFPDTSIPSSLDCGCTDPRRLDHDPEHRKKFCPHTPEEKMKIKEDAGFTIYKKDN